LVTFRTTKTGGRTIPGHCFAQELFNNSWANKSRKFVCPGTFLKKVQVPGHEQLVFICQGIMLYLRIIPGHDMFNEVYNIFYNIWLFP
jgi:hypothetical protein